MEVYVPVCSQHERIATLLQPAGVNTVEVSSTCTVSGTTDSSALDGATGIETTAAARNDIASVARRRQTYGRRGTSTTNSK